MSHEESTREESILLTGGYPQLMVVVGQRMLADRPLRLRSTPALVLPAAQMPFPYLLASHTAHAPLFIADPLLKNLTWQRERVGGRSFYVLVSAEELPIEIQRIGFVLNPFGLQHDLLHAPQYAAMVRTRCQNEAELVTLDWGINRYPDPLATLERIAADIRYSTERILAPYEVKTGWKLVQEREIPFKLPQPVEAVAQLLGSEEAQFVRDTFSQEIIVESSVYYRRYEAL